MRHQFTAIACLIAVTSALTSAGADATAPTGFTDIRGIARTNGKPQGDAVVWLDAPDAPRPTAAASVIRQVDLKFLPRVLAVQVGSTVEFPNDDRVFHNVFSFHDGKRFDLGLYPTGTTKHVTFDRPGVSRLFCNIHPRMAGYVMAVASPYFAVSDASGHFTLRGVPAGAHVYHAWRPSGAPLKGSVTVGPEARLEITWP